MKLEDLTIRLNAVDKTAKAFRSLNARLTKLRKLTGVAAKGVLAIGAAATSLVAIFKTFQGPIDNLAKAADKLGVTTEALQSMRNAAEFAGISSNKLDGALQRMIRRLGTVAETGGGAATKALNTLGLDAAELVRLAPEDQLRVILTELHKIEDVNKRLFVADGIFGKEGVDLVRLTGDAITDARKEMEELGFAISRIEAAKVEQANDQLTRMRQIIDGLKQRIAINLADPITASINLFIKMRKEAELTADDQFFQAERMKSITKVLAAVLAGIRNLVTGFQLLITGIIGGISEGILGVLRTMQTAFSKLPFFDGTAFDEAVNSLEFFVEGAKAQAFDLKDAWIPITGPDGVMAQLDKEFESLNKRAVETKTNIEGITAANGGLSASVRTIAPRDPVASVFVDGSGDPANDFIFNGSNINPALLEDGGTGEITAPIDAANDSVNNLESSLGKLGSAFGNFANAAGRNNEKAFKSFQKLQIALSTAAALSAAIQAAADPKLQGFAKLAAYASVLGTLLSGVAQLKAINLGSSSAPSAASGSASAPSGPLGGSIQQPQQQQSRQQITINVQGGEIITADTLEEIINEINDNDSLPQINLNRLAA